MMTEADFKTRAIIGLEIHVQLQTESKMFCSCPVAFDAPPNSCVCPVCLGLPGALPVINRRALEYGLLTGLALNCNIARFTKWDRKSYHYPDLPKNYQISQYDQPLAHDGHFDIRVGNQARRIGIVRAHLEEDAGKNIHDRPGCTLIDLNRAGTPLLEIVTGPDLASADEAYVFCTELQRLVTYLGVSEGSMQKGQMRFEPNVNVAIEVDGEEMRTPICEVKNLNSFRAVRDAIAYEIVRQMDAWRDDPEYLIHQRPNENRGWNDDLHVTEFQRGKEAAHDYRYFPDPDLPPVEVSDEMGEKIRASLPELPIHRCARFVETYDLSAEDAATIIGHRATADLFERAVSAGASPVALAKQFVNVWLKLAKEGGAQLPDLAVSAERIAELARITTDGLINKTAANQLAGVLLARPGSPTQLARELGLLQEQDTEVTAAWVDEAMAANEKAVRDALEKPKKAKAAMGFLQGQVMRGSGGKADPKLVREMIEQKLADLGNNG